MRERPPLNFGGGFSKFPFIFSNFDLLHRRGRSGASYHRYMSRDILDREAPAADWRITYGSEPKQFCDLRVPFGAREE